MSNLKAEVKDIDWSRFEGPAGYDEKKVANAIVGLMELNDSEKAKEVGTNLIYALGNDHSGVYYPVVLKALDYIITIAETTQVKACKVCALAVLNDLYYFEPEIGEYRQCSAEELKGFVKDKLAPYSDDAIRF